MSQFFGALSAGFLSMFVACSGIEFELSIYIIYKLILSFFYLDVILIQITIKILKLLHEKLCSKMVALNTENFSDALVEMKRKCLFLTTW